jgi:hypothetical protein
MFTGMLAPAARHPLTGGSIRISLPSNASFILRTITQVAAALAVLAPAPDALAQDGMPSSRDVPLIETHASTWDMVLKREQLRTMTRTWQGLTANPDSAAAYFTVMLPVADAIVDQLMLSTALPRGTLMRWLESDVGLKPYFFPPRPQIQAEKKGGGLLKLLSPLVPIIMYRVMDRMLD